MDDRAHFFKLLEEFSDGMLVTHSTDGELHARPMAKAAIEDNGDLWLLASANSGKVSELQQDARACFTMQQGRKYLSINGTCSVRQDPKKVASIWKEPWKVWFPKGPSDPSLVLIRIATVHGEYWDNSGVQAVRFMFAAAQAYLSGEKLRAEGNQQAKVTLPR